MLISWNLHVLIIEPFFYNSISYLKVKTCEFLAKEDDVSFLIFQTLQSSVLGPPPPKKPFLQFSDTSNLFLCLECASFVCYLKGCGAYRLCAWLSRKEHRTRRRVCNTSEPLSLPQIPFNLSLDSKCAGWKQSLNMTEMSESCFSAQYTATSAKAVGWVCSLIKRLGRERESGLLKCAHGNHVFIICWKLWSPKFIYMRRESHITPRFMCAKLIFDRSYYMFPKKTQQENCGRSSWILSFWKHVPVAHFSWSGGSVSHFHHVLMRWEIPGLKLHENGHNLHTDRDILNSHMS